MSLFTNVPRVGEPGNQLAFDELIRLLEDAFDSLGGGGVSDGDKGDITVSGSGSTWTIENDAITFAKIQNITDARLLGRSAGSSGDCQEISVGTGLSLSAGSLSATGGATFGQTTVSFSSGGGPYTATVSVSDAGVSAGSRIVPLAVAPAVGRDADEMEFCNFQTSVDSINAGVGFTLRVVDFSEGAHGDYLLNYVR